MGGLVRAARLASTRHCEAQLLALLARLARIPTLPPPTHARNAALAHTQAERAPTRPGRAQAAPATRTRVQAARRRSLARATLVLLVRREGLATRAKPATFRARGQTFVPSARQGATQQRRQQASVQPVVRGYVTVGSRAFTCVMCICIYIHIYTQVSV